MQLPKHYADLEDCRVSEAPVWGRGLDDGQQGWRENCHGVRDCAECRDVLWPVTGAGEMGRQQGSVAGEHWSVVDWQPAGWWQWQAVDGRWQVVGSDDQWQ
jgi:hypothetical protein